MFIFQDKPNLSSKSVASTWECCYCQFPSHDQTEVVKHLRQEHPGKELKVKRIVRQSTTTTRLGETNKEGDNANSDCSWGCYYCPFNASERNKVILHVRAQHANSKIMITRQRRVTTETPSSNANSTTTTTDSSSKSTKPTDSESTSANKENETTTTPTTKKSKKRKSRKIDSESDNDDDRDVDYEPAMSVQMDSVYRALRRDELQTIEESEDFTVITFKEDVSGNKEETVTILFAKKPQQEPENWDPNDFVIDKKEGVLRCKLCERDFFGARAAPHIKAHITLKHPKPGSLPWMCKYCPFGCRKRDLVMKHLGNKHDSDPKKLVCNQPMQVNSNNEIEDVQISTGERQTPRASRRKRGSLVTPSNLDASEETVENEGHNRRLGRKKSKSLGRNARSKNTDVVLKTRALSGPRCKRDVLLRKKARYVYTCKLCSRNSLKKSDIVVHTLLSHYNKVKTLIEAEGNILRRIRKKRDESIEDDRIKRCIIDENGNKKAKFEVVAVEVMEQYEFLSEVLESDGENLIQYLDINDTESEEDEIDYSRVKPMPKSRRRKQMQKVQNAQSKNTSLVGITAENANDVSETARSEEAEQPVSQEVREQLLYEQRIVAEKHKEQVAISRNQVPSLKCTHCDFKGIREFVMKEHILDVHPGKEVTLINLRLQKKVKKYFVHFCHVRLCSFVSRLKEAVLSHYSKVASHKPDYVSLTNEKEAENTGEDNESVGSRGASLRQSSRKTQNPDNFMPELDFLIPEEKKTPKMKKKSKRGKKVADIVQKLQERQEKFMNVAEFAFNEGEGIEKVVENKFVENKEVGEKGNKDDKNQEVKDKDKENERAIENDKEKEVRNNVKVVDEENTDKTPEKRDDHSIECSQNEVEMKSDNLNVNKESEKGENVNYQTQECVVANTGNDKRSTGGSDTEADYTTEGTEDLIEEDVIKALEEQGKQMKGKTDKSEAKVTESLESNKKTEGEEGSMCIQVESKDKTRKDDVENKAVEGEMEQVANTNAKTESKRKRKPRKRKSHKFVDTSDEVSSCGTTVEQELTENERKREKRDENVVDDDNRKQNSNQGTEVIDTHDEVHKQDQVKGQKDDRVKDKEENEVKGQAEIEVKGQAENEGRGQGKDEVKGQVEDGAKGQKENKDKVEEQNEDDSQKEDLVQPQVEKDKIEDTATSQVNKIPLKEDKEKTDGDKMKNQDQINSTDWNAKDKDDKEKPSKKHKSEKSSKKKKDKDVRSNEEIPKENEKASKKKRERSPKKKKDKKETDTISTDRMNEETVKESEKIPQSEPENLNKDDGKTVLEKETQKINADEKESSPKKADTSTSKVKQNINDESFKSGSRKRRTLESVDEPEKKKMKEVENEIKSIIGSSGKKAKAPFEFVMNDDKSKEESSVTVRLRTSTEGLAEPPSKKQKVDKTSSPKIDYDLVHKKLKVPSGRGRRVNHGVYTVSRHLAEDEKCCQYKTLLQNKNDEKGLNAMRGLMICRYCSLPSTTSVSEMKRHLFEIHSNEQAIAIDVKMKFRKKSGITYICMYDKCLFNSQIIEVFTEHLKVHEHEKLPQALSKVVDSESNNDVEDKTTSPQVADSKKGSSKKNIKKKPTPKKTPKAKGTGSPPPPSLSIAPPQLSLPTAPIPSGDASPPPPDLNMVCLPDIDNVYNRTGALRMRPCSTKIKKQKSAFLCKTCKETFLDLTKCKAHIIHRHPNLKVYIVIDLRMQQVHKKCKIYLCRQPTCSFVCKTYDDLASHVCSASCAGSLDANETKDKTDEDMMGEVMYQCNYCIFETTVKDNIREHMKNKHGEENGYTEIGARYGSNGQFIMSASKPSREGEEENNGLDESKSSLNTSSEDLNSSRESNIIDDSITEKAASQDVSIADENKKDSMNESSVVKELNQEKSVIEGDIKALDSEIKEKSIESSQINDEKETSQDKDMPDLSMDTNEGVENKSTDVEQKSVSTEECSMKLAAVQQVEVSQVKEVEASEKVNNELPNAGNDDSKCEDKQNVDEESSNALKSDLKQADNSNPNPEQKSHIESIETNSAVTSEEIMDSQPAENENTPVEKAVVSEQNAATLADEKTTVEKVGEKTETESDSESSGSESSSSDSDSSSGSSTDSEDSEEEQEK